MKKDYKYKAKGDVVYCQQKGKAVIIENVICIATAQHAEIIAVALNQLQMTDELQNALDNIF